MSQTFDDAPRFDLWTEPWITLERRDDGKLECQGIEQTLLWAGEYAAIYEQSPLVIVGIHRLLTAILQAALVPRELDDLTRLWSARCFHADAIREFGADYAHRFGLFSKDEPFLQSRDSKREKHESVAYLAPEIPSGVNVTHYRHGGELAQVFCPVCAAGGLVIMPAFTTIGGPGLMASINGTPPIYVVPGGKSLFESLAASLVIPEFQPGRRVKKDLAWWVRVPAVIEWNKRDVSNVGYLHGLTFTPRQVRLCPERVNTTCTRCGRFGEWGVRWIIFDKGESRPKDAPFWRDPFVAYIEPSTESKKRPIAIVPQAGKALWQDYAGLFLPLPETSEHKGPRLLRARVLDQIANLDIPNAYLYPFRCIGMRTEQMKFFEWVDADVQVPLRLLRDPARGQQVRSGIEFALKCDKIIAGVFNARFGGKSKEHKRFQSLRAQMLDDYWAILAQPFLEQFVPAMAADDQWQPGYHRWIDAVVKHADRVFRSAADALGGDAATFSLRVQGESDCTKKLNAIRKRYLKGVSNA